MTAQFGQVSKTVFRINPVINSTGTNWKESQQMNYHSNQERTYNGMF